MIATQAIMVFTTFFLLTEGQTGSHKKHQRSRNNHKSCISTIHKLSLSFLLPELLCHKGKKVLSYFLFHLWAEKLCPMKVVFLIFTAQCFNATETFISEKRKGVQNAPAFQTPSF